MGKKNVDFGAPDRASSPLSQCEAGGIPQQPKTIAGVEFPRGKEGLSEPRPLAMYADLATMHWFWTETMNRLESLRRRVREARDLMEAADFARYLLNSGMRKMLVPYDNQGLLKVDSAALGLSAADLLREVQELWRTNQVAPGYNVAQFEAILHRLDLIAGQLAKVPTAGGDSAAALSVPRLVVLLGVGRGE